MFAFFEKILMVIFSFFFGISAFFYPQAPAWPGAALPRLSSQAAKANSSAAASLPMLAFENALPLLQNPDRGLRMETYITLGEVPECYPGNKSDPYEKMLAMIEKYREDSPTVVQLYIYLCRYNDRPLDDNAFAQMERMLELCRAHNIRILLRFAYQNESTPDPNTSRVLEHLDQLGEWFQANGQLLDDTLYAVQAGIIGYWGEGHSNINTKGRYTGQIFNRLCSITPEDVFVQVRNIDQINAVSNRYQSRIGIHDDYIIGEKYGEWSFFLGRKRLLFNENRFQRTINDAEMPWGVATHYDQPGGAPLNSLNAVAVLQQIQQYALTTFSLEHNYRESSPDRIYSMARWKDVYFTPAQLEALGMPYLPSLFEGSGTLSAYDYIRYHLGYLLSVSAFNLDAAQNKLRFTIQNNGFAAPLNCNALSLVLDGTEYLIDSYDKYALGSMQAVTYTIQLPEDFNAAAQHTIGIKLAHCAGSSVCVRFANDTEFIDGVQMLV